MKQHLIHTIMYGDEQINLPFKVALEPNETQNAFLFKTVSLLCAELNKVKEGKTSKKERKYKRTR